MAVLVSDYGSPDLIDKLEESLADEIDYGFHSHDANRSKFGFTRANNILMQEAILSGYHYVLLINNDTVVQPGLIEEIRRTFKGDSSVGVVGCKVVSIDDKNTIQHGGTLNAYPNGVHKSGLVSNGDCNEETYEKWVTGCAMAVRTSCLVECGIFDRRYDLICQDSDYCYHIRSRGWKVKYQPKAVVYHHGGVSTGKANKSQLHRMKMDVIRFEDKWINNKVWHDLDNEFYQ